MRFSDLVAWPVSRGSVRLSWKFTQPGDYNVAIYRKVDEQPEKRIAVVHNVEQFLDEQAPTDSLARQVSYFIEIEGFEERLGPVVSGHLHINPVAALQTEKDRILVGGWGRLMAVFSRKTVESDCSCFDALAEVRTIANCRECKGTGKKAGYSDALKGYFMASSPENESKQVTPYGETEDNPRTFWTGTEIYVKPGDVLVTAGGKRFRIVNVTQTEYGDTACRQIASCNVINPADVEYDLPIPEVLLQEMALQSHLNHPYLA